MTKRLLDANGGVLTWFEKDPVTGAVTISYTQDCAAIIKSNLEKQAHHHGYSKSRDLRHVADIPMAIILQWRMEGVDFFNPNHKEAIRRKLNDPDYAYLRTSTGII